MRPEHTGPPFGGPGAVVAVQTGRRALRSGSLWGLVFGAYVASSSIGFAATYPTAAARSKLATSLESNAGIAALLGPARHIDTVAGFTGWRTTAVLTVVGAIWALFLASRLLRGEEDSGRWELYLTGQTTRARAAAQALLGLLAGLVALWLVTALLTLAIATSPKVGFAVSASLFFATCLVAGAAMFAALGALVSEVAANRRQANSLGALLIGAAFLIRLVADTTSGLEWLRWASPLGWVEELHPLSGSRPLAFLPMAALTGAAAAAAVRIAARRDLGASMVPSRDTPPPHTALLGSASGLAARLTRPVAIGWVAGVAAGGLVIGSLAQSTASALNGSASIQAALRRIGGHASGAKAFIGFAFSIVAALIAFAAAGQVKATRTEEASQHLDHLLVRPVSRSRWLVGRLAVAGALVVAISVVSGVASWLGAAAQGAGVGLGNLLAAGINLAPPAIFVLGIGMAVYGLLPRMASAVAFAIVGWSFLVQLVAAVVTSNHLLVDTSVLSHISPAPAASPNWTSAGILVLLGVLASGAGVLGFARRDLAVE